PAIPRRGPYHRHGHGPRVAQRSLGPCPPAHPPNQLNPETRMRQSLAQIYLHVVFSTKHRRPFLQDSELRDELRRYLGGVFAVEDLIVGTPPQVTGLPPQSR